MTLLNQFAICYLTAARIVSTYRGEAPKGCDPQNTYVALATAVVGAGTAAYSAYSQKKEASKAASAGSGGAQFQPLDVGKMPKYIPVNLGDLENTALTFDRTAYNQSDKDFATRHKPLLDAEKLFENQTLKDQQGDTELMPAIQNEFIRAGLTGALSAFGDTPGTLAPGSAGEASVARNLGLSITGFQDRNRANRQKSLITAEELFPRRNFGLSGEDASQVQIANTAGQNNWNQADYANQVQLAQFNATGGANAANAAQAQANANTQAAAVQKAESNKAILSAAEMVAKLGASYAGGRTTTAATPNYGNPSGVRPNTTGWTTGPQKGTFYVPKAA